jgi:hypothetical protein
MLNVARSGPLGRLDELVDFLEHGYTAFKHERRRLFSDDCPPARDEHFGSDLHCITILPV